MESLLKKYSDSRVFLPRLFFFLLPVAIFCIVIGLPLLLTGELLSVEQMVQKQAQNDQLVMIGLAYSEASTFLKLKSILYRNPQIIAIGNSRVVQFRSRFFTPSSLFYNAGCIIRDLKDFNALLDRLPQEKQPKVIIAALDQSFFNPNWMMHPNPARRHYKAEAAVLVWRNACLMVLKDYLRNKIPFSAILTQKPSFEKIGMSAMLHENGFINDGSYYYGQKIAKSATSKEGRFNIELNEILHTKRWFAQITSPSGSALVELDHFLSRCRERGIYVIGFLPPFAHQIYEQIQLSNDCSTYLAQLNEALRPMFKKHDFEFYDFSDLASVGATDEEALDGFHASEKACLRLLIKMTETSPRLRNVSDVEYLKKRLESSSHPYWVFSKYEF